MVKELADVFGSAASLSEESKLWLSRHPGLSIDEALHHYRDEQKTKQRLQSPKLATIATERSISFPR